LIRRRIVSPAVIALGSNLGDREANLRHALRAMDALDGVMVTAASGIVESHAVKPEGVDAAAPSYLNAVALVKSELPAERLLDELNRIEVESGRVREERWGDRTLDLDIVTFGVLSADTERLTLPHPRAWQRPFVIVPWLQVDPDATIQGRGRIDALEAAISSEVWAFGAAPLMEAVHS
jgi:2-amino-4-hydroxy-6-hydroxymethyldihydropteridine diphosphokinase